MYCIPFTKHIFISDIPVFSLSSEPESFLVDFQISKNFWLILIITKTFNMNILIYLLLLSYVNLQATPLHTVSTILIAVFIRHNQNFFQNQEQ